ncbi:MAG: hypothetical protein QW399_06600 [Sulfolobales archaeon]
MRIAFMSGGKDSYYAVYKFGYVDLGIMLIYDFPRPNPHTLNLSKSVETILNCGIPVLITKLSRGREFEETVGLLKKFYPEVIVAGDVCVEEHLKYMERIAREVNAKLVEPLWGADPLELLHKEVEEGLKPLIIGAVEELSNYLGKVLTPENVEEFIQHSKIVNLNPLGEYGEYHTLVLRGPLSKVETSFTVVGVENFTKYNILRIM